MDYRKIDLGNGIFLVEHFLSKKECERLIRFSEEKGFEEAKINTQFGEQNVKDVRNNDRILYDDHELANSFFEKLKTMLPAEINYWHPSGLNEKFRFYRYTGKQYFKWHVDGSFKRDYFEVSKLTVLFYLNEDYDGGETEFETLKVSPKTGMALVFPHKLRHQGSPLLSGTKYVLRSDVMYAKI